MSINIVLCGASGRLGMEFLKETKNYSSINLMECISSKNNVNVGKKFSEFTDLDFELKLKDSLAEIEVAHFLMDMSSPNFFEEIVKYCRSKKVPLILASTGHSEEQIDILRELSQIVPIMHAPNLSVGINLVKKIINFYPLDDLVNSIEIIETHHKNKLDSPSGTAIELRNLIKSKNREVKISVKSIRDEDSVGVHTIKLNMANETIEITHRANSRKIFAQGAITAVHWIKTQKPGFYSLSNI